MKFPFPHFPSRQKTAKLTRQDERVFAEASELAQLRLEQCIADLQIWPPTTNHALHDQSDRVVFAERYRLV
jgi:hypothetical protein